MPPCTMTWVGVVLTLVFLVGTTSAAAAVPPERLTTAQRHAIRHAEHPYVRSQRDRGVAVLFARRTSIGTRRVIVAQVECKTSTSGAPVETAVYGRRGDEWCQLYRLDSGQALQRGHYSIAASETFRVARAAARARVLGLPRHGSVVLSVPAVPPRVPPRLGVVHSGTTHPGQLTLARLASLAISGEANRAVRQEPIRLPAYPRTLAASDEVPDARRVRDRLHRSADPSCPSLPTGCGW